MDCISKQKKLYIICFIIQVPSIILTAFAPIIMHKNIRSNYSLCTQIFSKSSDGCEAEFKKLFPSGYSFNGSDLHGLDIIFFFFLQ